MTPASPPFDPRGFLDLASSLVSGAVPTEAHSRAAISRAYYAVFLRARERLASSGRIVPTRTGRDHRIVIDELKRSGGFQGQAMDKLLHRRTQADYVLTRSPSTGFARQTVQTAASLWNAL